MLKFKLFRDAMLFVLIGSNIGNAGAQAEILVTASSSHFLGDLGGKPAEGTNGLSDINLSSTRWMAGLGLRKYLNERISLRTNVYTGRLSADDRFSGELTRRNRNLNFFSPVTGANLMLEFHFGANNNWYAFGGAEIFRFNPKTVYQGNVVELQPLGTEGQLLNGNNQSYKLHSLAIPFGIGYKFLNHSRGHWSFEVNGRKTFTDYIDDVSTTYADKNLLLANNGQVTADLSDRNLGLISDFSNPGMIRGNPRNNDNFFFLSINYVHRIGSGKANGHGNRFYNKQSRQRNKRQCFQF